MISGCGAPGPGQAGGLEEGRGWVSAVWLGLGMGRKKKVERQKREKRVKDAGKMQVRVGARQ